ncbi:dihydrolipoyl dehydrogenase family protein [Catelliglobosispora koreensis]|uniref:dihydrolipoyl dehydrogenase family protein n=1 Tax=Catelliglobosispora koreensis TaxID=129052 RepID=UPI000363BA59|nr:NAD(P)/FAD-dependent oxidoreductase [Catelliglobosispora koreensis]
MAERVDVVVAGLGVAGEEVAGKLAEAGLSVIGIEGRLVGGECPYYGCVPSKMMIRAANLLAEGRRIPGMAGACEISPSWEPVATRIRDEATDNWDDKVAVDRFTGKGGRFVRGWAKLDGPGRVLVGDDVFEATRAVVIGTGTSPAIPPIEGLSGTPYWSNREAVAATQAPESLLVLGGGAIGLELAQAFSRFGSAVTIVEALDRIAAAEEPETSAMLAKALGAEGIQISTGNGVKAVSYDDGRFTLTLNDGQTLSGEKLLVATGRKTELGNIGAETVGLNPKARFIEVDGRMRAGEKLWAVGDVTGKGAFTHMAMYQAGIAIRDILGQEGPPADYRTVPRVTFTDPEVGSAGITEAQARERGLTVQTGISQTSSSARGWIHKAGNEGFIKLVADADRGVLVGATASGPAGGEVLGALTVAIHGEVPVEKLRHMIYAYPTFHRGIEDALRDLK